MAIRRMGAITALILFAVCGVVVLVLWSASPPPAAPAIAEPEQPRVLPTVAASNVGGFVDFAPDNAGRLTLGTVVFRVIHYDTRWSGVDQGHFLTNEPGFPRQEGTTWELRGNWRVGGSQFAYQQRVENVGIDAIRYEVNVTSEEGVQTNALALGALLPTADYAEEQIVVDGAAVVLPLEKPTSGAEATLVSDRMVDSVEVATRGGRVVIQGPAMFMLQDNRFYGEDGYYIRIGFAPQKGLIKEARLKLQMRCEP